MTTTVAPPAEPTTSAPATGRIQQLAYTFAGGLPRTFWTLFAGQLINRLGNMVLPMLVFYLGAKGLSDGQIGIVHGALGAGALVSHPLGGWLADKYGRRTTLIVGLVSTSAALIFVGSVSGVPMLMLAAAIFGAVSDIYRPAASALVTDVVPAPLRAKAFGLIYWAINLGFAISTTAAGFLAAHGYWLLFAVDAGAMAAFALVIIFGIKNDSRPDATTTPTVSYLKVLTDRLLLMFTALNLAAAMIYSQAYVTLPLAMRDDGLSTAKYGMVIALNGVLIIVLQPLLTPWLSKFKPMHMLAVSWLGMGTGMALTGLAETTAEYAATIAVWTLGEVAAAGFVPAMIASIAPAAARARYQGIAGWSWSAAYLFGPLLGANTYAFFGPAALWWSVLVLAVTAATGAFLLAPAMTQRAQQSEAEMQLS
ncbi:MAG: MFS transporter [Corynebacteriales bacterium]|nr:MFS transporter [Mycobacteriales bacterium]